MHVKRVIPFLLSKISESASSLIWNKHISKFVVSKPFLQLNLHLCGNHLKWK